MRIDHIAIQNFRQFENWETEFSPQFNVLIGDNGAGKTTILDALAVALGAFFLGIDEVSTRPIRYEEWRINRSYVNGELSEEKIGEETSVSARGIVHGKSCHWKRAVERQKTTSKDARTIQSLSEDLQKRVRAKDEQVVLPLIGYHATGRLFHHRERRREKQIKIASRFRGYTDCLAPQSFEETVFDWWKQRELAQVQRDEPVAVLEGVRNAVAEAMPEWQHVMYDLGNREFVARNDAGNVVPVKMLSDGQRNVLYLVSELAYRAAVLNPHLGDRAYAETPGVVLIDEIDLHLHPTWQSRIVDDLRRTFRKVQFIATTHSPLIIQSLRPGELIGLSGPITSDYANRSPEDILENVMDKDVPQTSERSKHLLEVAERYYALLQSADVNNHEQRAALKSQLDTLLEPYSENEAFVALLRRKRAVALREVDVEE